MQGAQAGMAFGPLGAGIGAAVGLGAGILGGNKAQDEQARFAKNSAISYNNSVSGQQAMGGPLKMYGGGGHLGFKAPLSSRRQDDPNYEQPGFDFSKEMLNRKTSLPEARPIAQNIYPLQARGFTELTYPGGSKMNTSIPSVKQRTNDSSSDTDSSEDDKGFDYKSPANQLGRLTPMLSNYAQLKGLKRPNPVGYVPLRNTYQYDPVDEVRQERMISQEGNNQMASIGQSGASQGQMINAMRATGLNTMKARSQAAMSTEEVNRNQRLSGQQSQLGVNQYNNQLSNKAIDETRMDQGNYDTQKSKFIGQIGSDTGEFFKERAYADKAGQMFGYDENGKYLLGPKGEKIRVPNDQKTSLTPEQQAYLDKMPKAYGGYLLKNKKRY